ncbi:MAG: hypothetical protein GY913_35310 [Proteobacteria bacterium]|nr:hypothetical protein [Pseudomonadota bacterium]MCP4922200.1 hypothetical protein [Pseudomonadota bacterium]
MYPAPEYPSILEQLALDWKGSLAIATAILLLFVVAEVWKRRTNAPTEWTRKLTHLGSGVIVMTFPWLVESVWSVVLLAASFGGLLAIGKVTGLLSSVHDVERKTQGAYLYPLAVLGVFIASDGDALLFCVPLAIMAVADTGAAIVGKHTGGTKYTVLDGERSLEGSLTFFGLAFAICIGGLALAGRPGWPASLLVTLVVAALTTSVEAVSVRGSDNVLIPYAAWLALDRTMELGLSALEPWLLGMLFAGTTLAVSWRRADLSVAGGVIVWLIGSLAYASGGWTWAVPFYSLYGVFLLAKVPRRPDSGVDDVFATAAGSLALLLAYVHTGSEALLVPFLVTVSANAAILMAFLSRQRSAPWRLAIVAGAFVPPAAAWAMGLRDHVLLVAAGGLVGLGLFLAVERLAFPGRRLVSSLGVGVLAWVLLG